MKYLHMLHPYSIISSRLDLRRAGAGLLKITRHFLPRMPRIAIIVVLVFFVASFGCGNRENQPIDTGMEEVSLDDTPFMKSSSPVGFTSSAENENNTEAEGEDTFFPLISLPASKDEAENEENVARIRPVNLKGLGGEFTLQLGAFIFDNNLDQLTEELKSLGFVPYTEEVARTANMYCPIVLRGAEERESKEFVTMLSRLGLSPFLLNRDDGKYDVSSGVFYYESDAQAHARILRGKGYEPVIEVRNVELVLTRLRTGNYATVEEAEKDIEILEEKGLSAIIVKMDQ